ncbi:MAG: protealysin inhibitor emfourin [Actinoallomurus sp.]
MVRRAEVDSADHPAVARLVDEVDLGEVPKSEPAADRFVYDVEVGDHCVPVGEADLRGPLRELVDYVLAHGR